MANEEVREVPSRCRPRRRARSGLGPGRRRRREDLCPVPRLPPGRPHCQERGRPGSRKTGTVEGYNYSPANKNSGIVWDEATFTDYIKDPRAKIPGTKMVYAGLKDEQRIKDLIAYLHQFDNVGQK